MFTLLALALLSLRLHLVGAVVAPTPAPAATVAAAPAPPAVRARRAGGHQSPGRVAPPLPGASSLDNSAQHHPGANGGTVPTPGPGRAPTPPSPAPSSPVPAPGPNSPTCEPGQTPAVNGCAQGQLPTETTGRELW